MPDAEHPAATEPSAEGHDWRTDITMPDDETQTLADVLDVMRSNDLQRQAAFVEWLAGDWYDASTDGKRLFSVSLSMTVEADSMEEADELLAEALDAPWFGGGGWTTTEVDPNA